MEKDRSVKVHIGCLGCLTPILFLTALWALIFGLTWGGTHYDLQCSSNRGVEIKKTPSP